jgi:hypothetical protein
VVKILEVIRENEEVRQSRERDEAAKRSQGAQVVQARLTTLQQTQRMNWLGQQLVNQRLSIIAPKS